MKGSTIIGAWKAGLSETATASLPENPAGSVELTTEELRKIAAGGKRHHAAIVKRTKAGFWTWICACCNTCWNC